MDILTALDSARSLTVAILYRYNEFEQIVNLSFNPFDYNDLVNARDSLQATELLRKHEDLPTNIDKSSVAFESFRKGELACGESNERIYGSNSHATKRFVSSRKISTCLGPFHASDMFEFAGWGPGVTLTLRGSDATSLNKFSSNQEATVPLWNLVKPYMSSQYPNWPVCVRNYEGNRVITVPKNAKTDRIIAVEPSLNLFFQKGIGTMIRRRLALQGIDLNDQVKNKLWAQYASKTGLLATVDFTAASDTISYACVHDLFQSSDWFRVMDKLRSPRGLNTKSDSLIEYEKFSSMGNGFTFELESLIFWALAKACVPENHPLYDMVSVYGDDVIIPVEFLPNYIELCSFYGFTINTSKSFSDSYYRESCGGHYWNGIDITPVYLRRSLSVKRQKMIFHNQLVELSIRMIGDGFRSIRYRHIIALLSAESEIKNPVPRGFGDLGLTKGFDECSPTFCRKYHRGYYVKISSFQPSTFESFSESLGLVRLYDLFKRSHNGVTESLPCANKVTIPRRGRFRVSTTWTPDWPSLGQWV